MERLSSDGEERILAALRPGSTDRRFFLEKLPSQICTEVGIPPTDRDILRMLMVHLLHICTQAQEEAARNKEGALWEHQRVQELVGINLVLLKQKVSGAMTETQLRTAAAMVRRAWTPLGQLSDSVALTTRPA